jgi:hypothetical protein
MEIIDNILEEHNNRAKWIDENLSTRERARLERHYALSIIKAAIIYLTIMGIMYIFLK